MIALQMEKPVRNESLVDYLDEWNRYEAEAVGWERSETHDGAVYHNLRLQNLRTACNQNPIEDYLIISQMSLRYAVDARNDEERARLEGRTIRFDGWAQEYRNREGELVSYSIMKVQNLGLYDEHDNLQPALGLALSEAMGTNGHHEPEVDETDDPVVEDVSEASETWWSDVAETWVDDNMLMLRRGDDVVMISRTKDGGLDVSKLKR